MLLTITSSSDQPFHSVCILLADNLSQALVSGNEGFPLISRILVVFLQILLQDRSTKVSPEKKSEHTESKSASDTGILGKKGNSDCSQQGWEELAIVKLPSKYSKSSIKPAGGLFNLRGGGGGLIINSFCTKLNCSETLNGAETFIYYVEMYICLKTNRVT